jgi:DNA repair protein RecN (Recombination protein N)
VDELPAKRKEIAAQLELAENTEGRIAALKKEAEQAKAAYSAAADSLTAKRTKAACRLEKTVSEELAPLKMAHSKLRVDMTALPEQDWGAHGKERIQFLVQTNPGSAFGPLSKIASGGELSRFMLALKVALSDVRSAPTLIFDEIDTGIGGAVAEAVGKRLAKLGQHFQVMAVTHQPQVAALGTYHLKVEKEVTKAGASTSVQVLSDKARKEELARMLAGSTITEEARAAALKLMGAGS